MESASSFPGTQHKRWPNATSWQGSVLGMPSWPSATKLKSPQRQINTSFTLSCKEYDDITMLIGDFNAKLDNDRRGLHMTVGPHRSANSMKEERLLILGSTDELIIGNTFFNPLPVAVSLATCYWYVESNRHHYHHSAGSLPLLHDAILPRLAQWP